MSGRDLAVAVVLAALIHCGTALVRIPTPNLPSLPGDQGIAISLVAHDPPSDVSDMTVHEAKEDGGKQEHVPKEKVALQKKVKVQEKKIEEKATKKAERKAGEKIEKTEERKISKGIIMPVETSEKSSPSSDGAIAPIANLSPLPQGKEQAKKRVTEPAIPCYKSNPSPKYPEIARRRGYEGEVLLSVMVADDGTVATLKVKQSSGHSILDRAAVKAVALWKFEPARRMGVPVPLTVDIPVRFVLRTP